MAITVKQCVRDQDRPTRTRLREAAATLRESFGVEFDFWVGPAPWSPLARKGHGGTRSATLTEPQRCVAGLLARHLNEQCDPQTVDTSDGSYLLVIPLEARPLVVATATFARPARHWTDTFPWQELHGSDLGPAERPSPCCEPQLLLRMARLLIQNLGLKRQGQANRLERDAYVGRVSQSYEELALWHRVTKCLDVDRDHWQVARTVLPWLQQLIHAEALVLIEAQLSDGQPKAAGRDLVGPPKVWIGRREFEDSVCLRLLSAYGERAARDPLVKNHVGGGTARMPLPGVESFIVVALARGEDVLGWLVALNRTDGQEFGTGEASLMHSTAAILTAHGHNVALFREKESLLVGVVRALVSAIDAKDTNTRGHSERVGLIARRLGRELGLTQRACGQLYLTGMLHDIGKIGVADRVLCKRGKLTPAEFAEIKQHVEVGYAILKDLPQIAYALPGVRHHHERYNGTGYPDGLAGEQIPLIARIIAVADAFDAMSSYRPYREAVAPLQVEEILLRGVDQQWDARVVEAFFRALPEIRLLRETHVPQLGRTRSNG